VHEQQLQRAKITTQLVSHQSSVAFTETPTVVTVLFFFTENRFLGSHPSEFQPIK